MLLIVLLLYCSAQVNLIIEILTIFLLTPITQFFLCDQIFNKIQNSKDNTQYFY